MYLIQGGMAEYLKEFRWNSMKYRTDKSLKEITDVILQVLYGFF
jgi:hypothetical protein